MKRGMETWLKLPDGSHVSPSNGLKGARFVVHNVRFDFLASTSVACAAPTASAASPATPLGFSDALSQTWLLTCLSKSSC